MTWTVKIDKGDKANIERMLYGIKNGAPRVISRAMNKTIIGVKTDAKRQIAQEITVKQARIAKDLYTHKSSIQNLQASVEAKKRSLPLGYYSVSQTKTKGVTVKVFKRGERKSIPGAWLWISRGGHKVVLGRWWKRPSIPKRPKPFEYGILPAVYRYPKTNRPPTTTSKLKEFYGPRIWDIFSNESVMKPVLQKADDRFQKNLANQLDRELNKV